MSTGSHADDHEASFQKKYDFFHEWVRAVCGPPRVTNASRSLIYLEKKSGSRFRLLSFTIRQCLESIVFLLSELQRSYLTLCCFTVSFELNDNVCIHVRLSTVPLVRPHIIRTATDLYV